MFLQVLLSPWSQRLDFCGSHRSLPLVRRPDNLVPAQRKSTMSTFEHSLVLSKNGTISSTNWENQYYFETLSAVFFRHWLWNFTHLLTTALSLSVENSSGICVRSNTDHDCKYQWHFGAGLADCAKRPCTLLSIYYSYLMVISCNTFGVATSPNAHMADLSTSFNGIMNLNMWSCPSSSFGIVLVGFQEHYLKFWAQNRALNADKTRDAQNKH